MQSTNIYVAKKSEPIPIKLTEYNNNYDENKMNTSYKQTHQNDLHRIYFELKQNCFDPTKFSPPNDFMIKLYARLNNYYDKKDDMFVVK